MVYELEKEHKKSSLMCKKKEELVKEIMRLEHNVNALSERLNVQANAIKHYEQESRNKAIDETIEKIKNWLYENNGLSILDIREINEIAEQLKGGAVDMISLDGVLDIIMEIAGRLKGGNDA